ncbi:MAG: hypothetical protein ACOH2P_09695 [Pseudomonas sp.]
MKDKADLLRVEEILRSDASITLLANNAGVGGVMPMRAGGQKHSYEGDQWDAYEAQRQTLSGLFGNSTAAPRYR